MSDQNKSAADVKVRVFRLANRLRNKLGIRAQNDHPGHIDPEAIKEADKLIADRCAECPVTIKAYLDELAAQWRGMRDMPQSPERDQIAQKVFTTAHEIKDIGSMCGYGLPAYFAESLRDFVAKTELELEAQRVIIQAHVDALQVVIKKDIRDIDAPEAAELKKMVKVAIDKYS